MDWEARVAALWAEDEPPDLVERMTALAAEHPGVDGTGVFELAGAHDSTGSPELAVPLYEEALRRGLTGSRRRQATVQLASSLRNLGRPGEGAELLAAELDQPADALDDAVRAFLALCLLDVGREREAVGVAVGALAPHLTRYRRSLEAYAEELRAR